MKRRATEIFDLGGGARFLRAELVARKREDGQALRLIFSKRRLESLILGRVATLRGDIDDEQHAPLVGRERSGLAVDIFDGDIVGHCGPQRHQTPPE